MSNVRTAAMKFEDDLAAAGDDLALRQRVVENGVRQLFDKLHESIATAFRDDPVEPLRVGSAGE